MAEAAVESDLSIREQVSEEEWALRVDLAACHRLSAHFGWTDHVFGHITARIPGPEKHYLIGPFGWFFDEVTASSMVKIDQDGNVLLDETGLSFNLGGFIVHGAIHQAREDAHCIIHLHDSDGIAVSALKDGLLPINQDAMAVIHDVAYHDYEGFAIDTEERERFVANVGEKNYVILRNHGLLTMGPTMADAFSRFYALQKCCAMQVKTLGCGLDVIYPSQEIQDKVRDQFTGQVTDGANLPLVIDIAWDGLLRKLDRIDTSYRD